MPVLQCIYETKEGIRTGYTIPFSKISHLSYVEAGDNIQHFMHTVSGAKLYIGKADYDKINEVMCQREGVNNDNDLHDN